MGKRDLTYAVNFGSTLTGMGTDRGCLSEFMTS